MFILDLTNWVSVWLDSNCWSCCRSLSTPHILVSVLNDMNWLFRNRWCSRFSFVAMVKREWVGCQIGGVLTWSQWWLGDCMCFPPGCQSWGESDVLVVLFLAWLVWKGRSAGEGFLHWFVLKLNIIESEESSSVLPESNLCFNGESPSGRSYTFLHWCLKWRNWCWVVFLYYPCC